ncbi:hypothetical protein Tco_1334272 [Tanacetum coccineum]
MWNRLANTIREAAKKTLGVVAGTLRTRIGHRESWWITNKSAAEERYKKAKREAKKAVARGKEKAYEDLYKRLDSKEGENDIYRHNEKGLRKHTQKLKEALRKMGRNKAVGPDEIPIEAWRCLGGEVDDYPF